MQRTALCVSLVTSVALLSPLVPASAQALGQSPHHSTFDSVTNYGGTSNNKFVFCNGPDCPDRTPKYLPKAASPRAVIPAQPLAPKNPKQVNKETKPSEDDLPPK